MVVVALTDRQKQILRRLIKEYIKAAVPISSDFLKAEGFLDVSPATIRIELAELTDGGYLEKMYISGGRVPTDKGYRFFVDELQCSLQNNTRENRFQEIFQDFSDTLLLAKTLAKQLANSSSNLALVYLPEAAMCWREGWEKISREPEFEDITYWRNFLKSIDELEQKLTNMSLQQGDIQVFIGREGPCRNKDYSFIIAEGYLDRPSSPQYHHVYFTIAGPKRMDFNRNISLINELSSLLNKN